MSAISKACNITIFVKQSSILLLGSIALDTIETSFGFNTLGIVNGKPKILNLKEFISEFVNFREETLTKRIKFYLI